MSERRRTAVQRRDQDGDFHDVEDAGCPVCGCTYNRALDDPAIVWEPGSAWGPGCSDRGCRCHVEAIIGERRDPGTSEEISA